MISEPPLTASGAHLFSLFTQRHRVNRRGGWRARWNRRAVWLPLVIQRLGLQRPMKARLFSGQRMTVVTGETVSRQLLGLGYAEAAITALMCHHLASGDSSVDIGTHFGYEAMLMAELVGPSGTVNAFEPNPEAHAIAAQNLAPYSWTKLHAIGLSDHGGKTRFTMPALSNSAFGGLGGSHEIGATAVDIELRTLDTVLAGRTRPVKLIKCDAEGHDAAILRGALALLAADRPALVLETGMPTSGETSRATEDLMTILAPLGYQPFGFEFDGRLRIGPIGSFPVGHANTLFLTAAHPLSTPR